MIAPAVLHRCYLPFFVREVFRQLHPGEDPLDLAWYLQAMCHALEQTRRGKERRLVINVPPRYLKSVTTAVAFCAWILGHDPTAKILVGTYNEELARLHDQQLRQIMESREYRTAFPNTVVDRRRSRQLHLITTEGGSRMAVTTGGTATGFGGDFIILDDCMKAQDASSEAERAKIEQWYRGTIGTGLNDKRSGVIISIQQRLHENDLAAVMLEAGAKHLNLPAIAPHRELIEIAPGRFHERQPGDLLNPDREDDAVLEERRREMGPRNFATQYLQDPVPPDGNIVRLEWFPRFEEAPASEDLISIVQSWDTAMSADPSAAFSVCTTWGFSRSLRRWCLLDVLRKRLEYPELKRAVTRLWREWQPDKVLIEDATMGKALYAEFRAEGPFLPLLCAVNEGKEERLIAQTGQLEAGRVMLPQEAPWLHEFCRELLAAPNGRYWDQVDSTTQFLEYATWRRVSLETERDPKTGRLLARPKVNPRYRFPLQRPIGPLRPTTRPQGAPIGRGSNGYLD
jgi:predicted phage terminase large subunit-like protein